MKRAFLATQFRDSIHLNLLALSGCKSSERGGGGGGPLLHMNWGLDLDIYKGTPRIPSEWPIIPSPPLFPRLL